MVYIKYIPFAMFAYNSINNSTTDYQPYELFCGGKVELSTSMTKSPEPQYVDYQFELKKIMQGTQEISKNRLLTSKEKSKKKYDEKSSEVPFAIGEKVYLE
jgi:hypothetical protein